MDNMPFTGKQRQGKNGSLTTGLLSQYSTKNNQYPVIVTYAAEIMNNHRHDNYIIQGRNSHNRQNEIQKTETKPQILQMIQFKSSLICNLHI